MLNNDPDMQVQASAASALGRFIYLGELDVFPERIADAIEKSLKSKFDKSKSNASSAAGYRITWLFQLP